MSGNDQTQIIKALSGLEGKVEQGFKGMHDRQDRTNGNVKKNRDDIDILKDKIADVNHAGKTNKQSIGVLEEERKAREADSKWLKRAILSQIITVSVFVIFLVLQATGIFNPNLVTAGDIQNAYKAVDQADIQAEEVNETAKKAVEYVNNK